MMPLVTAENTPLPRGAPRPVAALPEGADFAAVLGRLRAMMAPEQRQPAPTDGPVVEAPPEGEEGPEAATAEPEVEGTPEVTDISQDSAFGAFLALPEGTAAPASPTDQASPPVSTPGGPGRESLLRARLVLDGPGAAPFVADAAPGPVQSVAAASLGTAAEAPIPDQPPAGSPTPDTRPADPPLTPHPLGPQAGPFAQATPQRPALTDPLAPESQGSAPDAGTDSAHRARPGQSEPETPPPPLRPEGQAQPSRLSPGVATDAQGIAAQDQRSDQSRPPLAQPGLPGIAQPAPHQTQTPLAGRFPTRLDQAQPGQTGPNAAQPDQTAPHRTQPDLAGAAPSSQTPLTGRIQPRLTQVQTHQTGRNQAQPDQTAPDRTQTHQAPPTTTPSQPGQHSAAALVATAPMRASPLPLAPSQAQAPVTNAAAPLAPISAARSATNTVMSPAASPDPVPQPETPPQAGTRVPGAVPAHQRSETSPLQMTAAAVPAPPPGGSPGNHPLARRPDILAQATPPPAHLSAPAAPGLPARDPPSLGPVALQPTPATAADPAPRPQASAYPAAAPMAPGAPPLARQPDPAPIALLPVAAAPVPPPRAPASPARDPYGPARAVFAAAEPPRAPAMAAALLPGQPYQAEAAPIARPPATPDRPPPQAAPPGAAIPTPGVDPVPLAPPGTADPMTADEQTVDLVQRLDAPQRAEVMADPRPGASPPLDAPHRIAQQIAARLETPGPGSFDLALKPEELGHVRLKLVSHETGSLLIVHAERPETLDLMRRHIGALEQDLRALGHDQLSLRFSGGNAGGAGQQATPHAPPSQTASPGAPPADARPQTQPAPAPPLRARDHLDLRL